MEASENSDEVEDSEEDLEENSEEESEEDFEEDSQEEQVEEKETKRVEEEEVEEAFACKVCLRLKMDTRLDCGHLLCSACAPRVRECPFCRVRVTQCLQIFWP
jgi:hypothetical protein